ncbi:RHS repeat-associated protein [Chryseobacterium vietnamense]|uniref:RHS repeat-associated core domain-containing protein n=1 Tax=Chryseobacterium vietnamense TaxID=866785 RepID=UPI00285DC8F2|nr:RHS repeat-associated core domain-containing protein [Chryseobacterium vietnamense]MDR6489834.1 RHS repeat-associated protein [Chryseobacterium vietnamense]
MKVRKVFGTETTDYLDGFQYTNSVLKFFPTAEGYFNVETGKYVYNYTDHLGNTRLSYAKNGAGTEIIEESNYYPFGLKHEGYNVLTGNPSYKYKYNGKELQENGMYDYGARFYMPDTGRFGTVDPRSQYTHEAYSYVWNNPIKFADPTGMQGEILDWIKDKNGGYKWDPNVTGPGNTPDGWTYVGKTGSYRIDGATVQLLDGGLTFTDIDEVVTKGASPATASIILSQNVRFGLFAFLAVASWYAISDFVDTNETYQPTRIDPMMYKHTDNAESNAGSESSAETDSTDVNGVNVPDARKGGGKNGQHKNLKAKHSAGEKYEEAKAEYERLKSKSGKTKEDVKARDAAEKQMKHWKKKADETGENHSRNAKGSR